ncbi:MAG: hypothetical protein IT178_05810 [Acidobacteria bacterium]|nr:hypothetical protein [Acidobacteriota bacterium]
MLRLYPQPFYGQYADDLEADFEDASRDALAERGIFGLMWAWLRAWRDMPVSLVREWCRTPWPIVSMAAVLVASFVLFSAIVRAYVPLQRYRARVASGVPPPPDSPELLYLMLLMVLIPVGSILLVSAVVVMTMRRRRGERPRPSLRGSDRRV